MLSPNTILRERYRIIHQLGHGGMGAVYQAMDENLSCVVAVKETFATNDEQRRAFKREAELLANLSHPTLPRVMDHFTDGDGQFLVMQFVPGHDLAELLELREQPFQVAKVLDWADQILDALEELHASKPPIVHRDIKPSNLKVTPRGRILLLDFGLAKGAAGQMSTADVDSHRKSIYGYTPNYAPIEQVRGAGTDPRSDLYALAATLWTLLTGRIPPDAVTRMAEKEEDNADPLRPARELNPQVPAAVSAALNRAMAVNRNQRFTTAAEFREILRDASKAKFESPTQPQGERAPAEPAASRPSPIPVKPLDPTQPPPTPVKPMDPSPEPQAVKPAPIIPHVPTMPVDRPPAVPTGEFSLSPATDNSRPFEDYQQPKSWPRAAMVGGGVLIAVILGIGLVAWQPWAGSDEYANENLTREKNASPTTPTSQAAAPVAPEGMVYVPGGTFMMGRNNGVDEAERPEHQVTVKPFFIDRYEANRGGTPITGVTWDQADRDCRRDGRRLPTEEEWEFAARGTDGRRYPWGNEWQAGSANANGASQGLMNVGASKGTTPSGAYDMVGNAWEWTATSFRAYPGGNLSADQPGGDLRVIRGGSYESTKDYATTTYRTGWPARGARTYDQTGFRCAKDAP